MKHQILGAFKDTPPRFHYSVQSSINEAISSPAEKKHRISRPIKIAIAAVLIAAIVPSAIFGASKLYGLLAKPQGVYGMKLSLPARDSDYPEYIKLVVDPPRGFETRPNLGEEKYCRVGEEATSGFSMALFRMNPGDDVSLLEKDVKEITETVMNGHPAYSVTPVDGYDGWDRIFIYFEDVNVTMLLYYSGVTQEELENFVDGISFTEGTENDHTFVGAIEPADEKEQRVYEIKEVFKELPRDTLITYRDFIGENRREITLTSQITDIRVTENISDLDREDLSDLYPYDEIVNENGDLLPKMTKIIQEGDGINTPSSKVLRKEDSAQVMVLADITYTNESNEDTLAYVDYWLNVLTKDNDGSFSHAEIIDKDQQIYANEYCDTERIYQSEHSDNRKQFYSFALNAHETKSVTIGFRCNKDQIDNAYFLLNADSSGISKVSADEDLAGANRYIFKVR